MVLLRKRIQIGSKRLTIKITPAWLFIYIVMIGLVAFTALPLVYMVSTAFKPIDELFIFPPRFLVRRPTTENFVDLVTSLSSSTVPFTRYIFNSLFTTVVTVLLAVLVSSMGAFSLVKYRPPGSKTIFAIVVAALMFSPHVTQIPRYLIVNGMGLINTYWALILPKIAVAYNFFLMKQFTEQVPDEQLEAARIDGANELVIFWRIVMPALKPAWATLMVLSFVANWNDFITPLIFTTSQAMKTLPLALHTIAGGVAAANIGRAGAVAAATFCMTVPTVLIFTIMQKRVIETMAHSGIKG